MVSTVTGFLEKGANCPRGRDRQRVRNIVMLSTFRSRQGRAARLMSQLMEGTEGARAVQSPNQGQGEGLELVSAKGETLTTC